MAELETPEKPITNKFNFPTVAQPGAKKPDAEKTIEKKGTEGEDSPEWKFGEEKNEKESGKEKQGEGSKLNFARFKDVLGEEPTDEDDLYNKVSTFKSQKENEVKERESKLSVLAQGRKALNEDKEYQGWNAWLKESPENLVIAQLASDYKVDGMSDELAFNKAKEKVKKELERDADWAADRARPIKANLKSAIADREQQIEAKLQDAVKDIDFVSPISELEAKSKEALSKTDTFLGMKLPKDEKERTKLLNNAYIEPKKLQEMLKNPDTYAKVSLFLKHYDQWAANISSRNNGKATVLEKLQKERQFNGGQKPTRIAEGGKKFSEKSFLGR